MSIPESESGEKVEEVRQEQVPHVQVKGDLSVLFKNVRDPFLAASLAFAIIVVTTTVWLAKVSADREWGLWPVIGLVAGLSAAFLVLVWKLHKSTQTAEIEMEKTVRRMEQKAAQMATQNEREQTGVELAGFMLMMAERCVELDLPEKGRREYLGEQIAEACGTRAERLEGGKKAHVAVWLRALQEAVNDQTAQNIVFPVLRKGGDEEGT